MALEIFNIITKDNILAAIAEIDKDGVRSSRQSSSYDLIYQGKRYPPKYVISLAARYATGQVREYDFEFDYAGRWIPLRTINMPDSITFFDFRDKNYSRTIYREKLDWLEFYPQINANENSNGWVYCALDQRMVPAGYVFGNMQHRFRINCFTIDLERLTDTFTMFVQPRSELRPY